MDANLHKEAKTTANHVHLWNYHQQLLLLWYVVVFRFRLSPGVPSGSRICGLELLIKQLR